MSGDSLTCAIAAYRGGFRRKALLPVEPILDRLEMSTEARAAWSTHFAKSSRADQEHQVLLSMLDLKVLADLNAERRQMREARTERYEELLNAARTLNEFFANELALADYAMGDEAVAKLAHKHILAGLTSTRWASQYVSSAHEKQEVIFNEILPLSQKTDQPDLAFAMLLCARMEALNGQPAYQFVSAMTAAIYQRADRDVGEIAKAYRGERGRRRRKAGDTQSPAPQKVAGEDLST